jgi:hypothetical protein
MFGRSMGTQRQILFAFLFHVSGLDGATPATAWANPLREIFTLFFTGLRTI